MRAFLLHIAMWSTCWLKSTQQECEVTQQWTTAITASDGNNLTDDDEFNFRHEFNGNNIESIFDPPYVTERFGCGHWQEKYTNLHKQILSGKRLNKQLIFMSPEAGLADRLSGLITAFYFALLSGRAIRTLSLDFLPGFEEAFVSPHGIDWTVTNKEEFPSTLTTPLKHTYKEEDIDRNYSSLTVDTDKYYPIYLVNQHYTAETLYIYSNLTNTPSHNPDIEYIILASNRGMSFDLFRKNPAHVIQFLDFGFSSVNNCFTCAFFYLFAPNDKMKQRFSPLWYEMVKEPGALTIGKLCVDLCAMLIVWLMNMLLWMDHATCKLIVNRTTK